MPFIPFLPTLSRRNSFYVTLALAFGVFSAVLIFELYASRQREYQNAEQNARNMAHVLEEHTRATIEKIDLVLNDIVMFYGGAAVSGNPQGININGGLRTLLGRIPESQSLRIVDAEGNFIYDATGKLGSVNVSDRDYFLRNKNNPEAGLVISEPIFARLTNNWVITLSRRLEDRRGRFAGVVQAAVRAEFFQSFYQSLNVGSGGVVALYDTNLLLVARHPALESQIGKPLKNGLVEKPLREGVAEAVYSGKSSLDGVERLWNMRLVKGFPFLILVGLDHDDIYSQWYRKAFVYFLSAAVLALTLLMLARVWQRSYLRAINLAGEMTAAYEKSASQNRALLDSIPDMAWLEDCDGVIVAGNRTLVQALGKSERELIGAKLSAFLPVAATAELDVWRGEVLSRQVHMTRDYLLEMPGARTRLFDFYLVPARDGVGRVIGTAWLARDITDRREAEKALTMLNATLEQRVAEMVATDRKKDHLLIQQSRLAAMGEMVHNIAHQWRQPLNALAILIANIRDAYEFCELDQAYLERMMSDGNRLITGMSTTIDEFRMFFRSDPEKTEFALDQVVFDAVAIIDASLRHHGISVEISGAPLLRVSGYPNELSQAILNLLNNAKDAILERGIGNGMIRVLVSADEHTARIAVSDNAGGVAEDILSKIFDPYFTTREKGLGIGLYMTKMIVEENMRGRIEVQNLPHGACFSITLPMVAI